MIRVLLIVSLLAGCARSDSELVERSVVTGEMGGAPVSLQIDRQQSKQTQHSIHLPPGIAGAATGGWGVLAAAIASALGIGGVAAALRGGAVRAALQAVVKGVEKLRNDDELPAGVRAAIDQAMRENMGAREKKEIRKVKGLVS